MPVIVHNVRCGAGWTVSTNNERNFFVGNNPYTHHYKTSHLAQRDFSLFDSATRAYLVRFNHAPNPREAMMREAMGYITSHPFITAWRTLSRIRAFWGFDYIMSRGIQNEYGFGSAALGGMLLLEAGGYLLVIILSIVGFFQRRDRMLPRATGFLLLMTLAYQIPYMISFSAGTYHYPVVWLLMPLAGVGLAWLIPMSAERWRDLRSKYWFWISMGIVVLLEVEYAYYAIVMR
jgi:4-amino-4-deoxy-L-arabinose transferase-like glycosyltransferase